MGVRVRARDRWRVCPPHSAEKLVQRGPMTFQLSPEQDMLRTSVRAFLEDKMPMARVRSLMDTAAGHDADDWKAMAEQGFAAMHIPEDYGGAGFSALELGIVMEEMGRTMVPSPMLATVVLGANLLLLAASEEQKRTWLPALAAGETTATVALVPPGGSWNDTSGVSAVADGDTVVLNGATSYVVDGVSADVVLVAAQDSAGSGYFYIVPGDATGLSRRPLETLDQTRKQALLEFTDVRAALGARLAEPVEAVLDRLYDIAAILLAFEQVGGGQRCLEMSVEYANQRFQFGRPIGSFQAIKHKCADMLVAIEAARSAAYYAGWAATHGDPDMPVAAALAKTVCGDAFFDIAAETIQVHGGIGFTWEHDAHLYFKRAKSSQLMFGDAGAWRSKLADRIGLEPASH